MVTEWNSIYQEHDAELKAMREQTIEECARVAFETANVDERQKIADAIVALKDKL